MALISAGPEVGRRAWVLIATLAVVALKRAPLRLAGSGEPLRQQMSAP